MRSLPATSVATETGNDPSPWRNPALRATLFLLGAIALVAMPVALGHRMPSIYLYGFGAIFALVMLIRSLSDPEWVLAVIVIYIPLNKLLVVQILPGVNGTNLVLLLALFTWLFQCVRHHQPIFRPLPFTRTMMLLAFWSVVSAGVAVVRFGLDFMSDANLIALKEFVTQFVLFFAILNLIRDGAMARRVVIYMMISVLLVMVFGFGEWLDKRDASSIEASRVMGPQMQPNDFGAFLVYGIGPFVGLALAYLTRPWMYILELPVVVVFLRLLISTFSRGAYMGLLAGVLVAGWIRGRRLLVAVLVLVAAGIVAFPTLVPESARARMEQTTVTGESSGELDTSAETRLILWQAALAMTVESPIFGKGFRAFPVLKGSYTTEEVPESDNHNMNMYQSSQMGLPPVLLLLVLYCRAYVYAVVLGRNATDQFARAIGISAAFTVAAVFIANMFGSRLTDAAVSLPFWSMLAVLAHLHQEYHAAEVTLPDRDDRMAAAPG